MKLNPEHQIQPSDDLVYGVLDDFLIDRPTSWAEVSEGIGNVVVRVEYEDQDVHFLKFYNSSHALGRVAAEVRLSQKVVDHGLPLPRYIALKEGGFVKDLRMESGNHAVTLTESLAGEHPEEYDGNFIAQLGQFHGILHRELPVDNNVPFLDVANDYSYCSPAEMDAELQALDERAAGVVSDLEVIWEQFPIGAVHLDITRSNFLVRHDRVSGIVDFEDIANAPYVFCLAGTLWDMEEAGASPSQIDTYLAAYGKERQLSTTEHEFLKKIVILRGRIALHGSLLTGVTDEKIQHQPELLRKMIGSQ